MSTENTPHHDGTTPTDGATAAAAARPATLPIRAARADDPVEVDRVYEICLRTGAAGQDATARFTDPRLLGEVYAGAYLALEPELAFVVTDPEATARGEEDAVGYVLGAADTAAFEAELERRWWPALRARYADRTFAPGSPDAALAGLIAHPPTTPSSVTADYPAHLHIDLLPRAQGGGNGRRLIETLLDALRARGVVGVHLGVAPENTGAIGFYEHLGFRALPSAPGAVLLGRHLA